MAKPRIWVLGSLNADLVVAAERLPARGETVRGGDLRIEPGGKGANQAVAAARLGSGPPFEWSGPSARTPSRIYC